MIKKIGIEEILYGVKKYIALIVALTVVLGAVGFLTAGEAENVPVDYNLKYSSSKTYVVNAKEGASVNSTDNIPNCAYNIGESLKADFAKQYVFEKLKEKYSAAEIIAYTEAALSEEDLNYTVLNEIIVSKVLPSSTVVNFFASTKNLEFSKTITNLLEEYLKTALINQIADIDNCVYLGGTDVTLPDEQGVSSPTGGRVLNALIFAVIGFVLAMIFVLAKVFLNPLIAAKGDFEKYGVPVIFDKAEFRAQHQEFAADKLLNSMKNKEYNSIALISDVKTSCFKNAKLKLKKTLEENEILKEKGVSFPSAESVLSDMKQLEIVKSSGAVVLLERKGESYHKDYKNIVSQLKDYDIEIIGTMLI